ncbi:MAG: hypothetical protein OXI86_17285, partial [Candidatus Poribacteria bacterium]|nr:hypothetical protein [Candidatus Poribacteria bacterium]
MVFWCIYGNRWSWVSRRSTQPTNRARAPGFLWDFYGSSIAVIIHSLDTTVSCRLMVATGRSLLQKRLGGILVYLREQMELGFAALYPTY